MDMAGMSAVKLKVDTIKWLLARRVPQDFGDRLQVSGTTGASAQVNIYLSSKGGGAESAGGAPRVTIDGHTVSVDDE
jgi:hypothetical protein